MKVALLLDCAGGNELGEWVMRQAEKYFEPDHKSRYPTKAGLHRNFARFAGCLFLLDSGLRRNDGLIDFLSSTK